MNKEALLQCIRVLEEVRANGSKFDLSEWFELYDDNGYYIQDAEPHNCNTAACAVGWCCRDEWFKSKGLVIDGMLDCPILGETIGWSAVGKLFDLTHLEATHIFSDESYEGPATPTDVISRINEYLNQSSDSDAASAS
jgi:hypothetical protein